MKAFFVLSVVFCVASTALSAAIDNVTKKQWKALNDSVDGRLLVGSPFARSCFSQAGEKVAGGADDTACAQVMREYNNATSRIGVFGAYINTQWETCQTKSKQCLLNALNVQDSSAFAPPQVCAQGSVPRFYIDVRKPSDVQVAFIFSASTGVPVVIKNTGHDYKGHSSAPHSLALWTHNLQQLSYNASFVASGCDASTATPAVRIGAGVTHGTVYDFADAHGISMPGAAERTIGAVGGYLQGGGQNAFSNGFGLAVDNVLEFRVVTPRGDSIAANACQHADLFFALRGGGGGTFGVVMEATMRARPAGTFQVIAVSFDQLTTHEHKQWLKLIVDNAISLAEAGWGGYIKVGKKAAGMIFTNPFISTRDALEEMQEIQTFTQAVGGTFNQLAFTSYGMFVDEFLGNNIDDVLPIGRPFTVASRLIPAQSFQDADNRTQLAELLLETYKHSVSKVVLAVAPFSFQDDGQTSVTPAWRNALWHVLTAKEWQFDTRLGVKNRKDDRLSAKMDDLRAFTPGSGAYQNEADVHEPDFANSFWGSNYARLVQIKGK
ncbi:FAD-binding domain-containing protein [Daedaleopsis nitida]|nr:FAD-binding domain-containing protein [Daedaleopsis nitida]